MIGGETELGVAGDPPPTPAKRDWRKWAKEKIMCETSLSIALHMAKILLVEDDLELTERLREWFSEEKHVFEATGSGKDALQLLENYEYDVIILDWRLPDVSGIDILKRFRNRGGLTPVIFLTGRVELSDKESGLDAGADDYLVKPFHTRELSARIRSLLRRPTALLPDELSVKGVKLDPRRRTVKSGDTSAQLMPRECALLEYLMRHTNQTYSGKTLLTAVWPSDTEASEDTVRTCMKTLRRKLSKLGRDDLVKTVLGSGYIIEE